MLSQIRKLFIIIKKNKYKSALRARTVTVTEPTQVSMCVHPDKPEIQYKYKYKVFSQIPTQGSVKESAGQPA